MDKLQLTGQNLGRVFNFRNVPLHAAHLWCCQEKLPNLMMKTRPEHSTFGLSPVGYHAQQINKEMNELVQL